MFRGIKDEKEHSSPQGFSLLLLNSSSISDLHTFSLGRPIPSLHEEGRSVDSRLHISHAGHTTGAQEMVVVGQLLWG